MIRTGRTRGHRKLTVDNSYTPVNKSQSDIELSIKNGAKLVEVKWWNKIEYGIEYPEGGFTRIAKRIYDKLNNSKS